MIFISNGQATVEEEVPRTMTGRKAENSDGTGVYDPDGCGKKAQKRAKRMNRPDPSGRFSRADRSRGGLPHQNADTGAMSASNGNPASEGFADQTANDIRDRAVTLREEA